MILSQFDYQMYMDEIAELRFEMTQLLISMEYRHQTDTGEEFDRWWYGDGNAEDGGTDGTETESRNKDQGNIERYFAMKRRIEQIEGFLSRVQVEEQAHPKMRSGGSLSERKGRTEKTDDKNGGDRY